MNHSWIQMDVLEIKRQTPSFFSIKLAPPGESQFHFQAGQCVNVQTTGATKGYFSIASEPEEKRFIEFLVKDQPSGAAHELCRVKIGDSLKISDPFGKGYPIDRLKQNNLLLIGIGSGLSPLRSLLRSILRKDHRFKQLSFLYGIRNHDELPFKDEFELWSKKIKLTVALSQPVGEDLVGFKGRVTDFISDLSMDSKNTICCICGNKEMEEQVRKLLETKGVSKQNILLNY